MDENMEIHPSEESVPEPAPTPRPLLTVLLALVVGAAFFGVQTVVVAGFVIRELVRDPDMDVDAWAEQAFTDGTLVAVVICLAGLVVVPLVIAFAALVNRLERRRTSFREVLLLRWPDAKSLGLWLLVVVVYVVAVDGITMLLGHEVIPDYMLEVYRTAGSIVLLWLAIVVVAPISEELLFRGLLFRGLETTRMGWFGAAVITSLAWAMIHVQYDWYHIVVIFFGGMLLSAARQSSQSVITCILMHIAWNLIATVQAMLAVADGP